MYNSCWYIYLCRYLRYIFCNTRNNNNYCWLYIYSYTIRTGSFLHTAGQGTEEGHRGLALDTLRVTGQRQHGKQPTASHRQYKSSTYVSRIICRRYLFVVIILLLLFWNYYSYAIEVVPPVNTHFFSLIPILFFKVQYFILHIMLCILSILLAQRLSYVEERFCSYLYN